MTTPITIKTHAELNAIVAKEVMHAEPEIIYIATRDKGASCAFSTSSTTSKADVEAWIAKTPPYELGEWKQYEPYSTSIEAAWPVLEKVSEGAKVNLHSILTGKSWVCEIPWLSITIMQPTAPLAICLAALASVGIEVTLEIESCPQ